MEVILRQEIEKLGTPGDVVKVADGYARNYLLPKRLAVAATAANKKIVEQERQKFLRREAAAKGEAEELSKLMGDVSVTISHKAGDQDQLFGSVTTRNIADALAKENFSVDHRKILLDSPIKRLGEYKVGVKLHREVTAEITVMVVAEGREEEPAAAKAEAEAAGAEATTEVPAETAPVETESEEATPEATGEDSEAAEEK